MTAECIHHWLLDADSYAICKLCGAEKQDCRPSDLPALRARQWKMLDGLSYFGNDDEMRFLKELAGMR